MGRTHRHKQHIATFRFECKECLRKFKARPDLRRHVLGSHADRPCYYCSVCLEKFTSEMLGTSHKQKFHNREATIHQMDNEYTKELVESLTVLIEGSGVK